MIRYSCHRHVIRGLPTAESGDPFRIDLQLTWSELDLTRREP